MCFSFYFFSVEAKRGGDSKRIPEFVVEVSSVVWLTGAFLFLLSDGLSSGKTRKSLSIAAIDLSTAKKIRVGSEDGVLFLLLCRPSVSADSGLGVR